MSGENVLLACCTLVSPRSPTSHVALSDNLKCFCKQTWGAASSQASQGNTRTEGSVWRGRRDSPTNQAANQQVGHSITFYPVFFVAVVFWWGDAENVPCAVGSSVEMGGGLGKINHVSWSGISSKLSCRPLLTLQIGVIYSCILEITFVLDVGGSHLRSEFICTVMLKTRFYFSNQIPLCTFGIYNDRHK